jgi:hypothetical protein
MTILNRIFGLNAGKTTTSETEAMQQGILEQKAKQEAEAREKALLEQRLAQEKAKAERIKTLKSFANYVVFGEHSKKISGDYKKLDTWANQHRSQLVEASEKSSAIEQIMYWEIAGLSDLQNITTRYEEYVNSELKSIFPIYAERISEKRNAICYLAHERERKISALEEITSRRSNEFGYSDSGYNYLTPETLHIQKMPIIAEYDPKIKASAIEREQLYAQVAAIVKIAKKYANKKSVSQITRAEYQQLRHEARIAYREKHKGETK